MSVAVLVAAVDRIVPARAIAIVRARRLLGPWSLPGDPLVPGPLIPVGPHLVLGPRVPGGPWSRFWSRDITLSSL